MSGRNGELTSPVALPRASWKDTLERTVGELREDKLDHWAAALTYYSVLSLFPASRSRATAEAPASSSTTK